MVGFVDVNGLLVCGYVRWIRDAAIKDVTVSADLWICSSMRSARVIVIALECLIVINECSLAGGRLRRNKFWHYFGPAQIAF